MFENKVDAMAIVVMHYIYPMLSYTLHSTMAFCVGDSCAMYVYGLSPQQRLCTIGERWDVCISAFFIMETMITSMPVRSMENGITDVLLPSNLVVRIL